MTKIPDTVALRKIRERNLKWLPLRWPGGDQLLGTMYLIERLWGWNTKEVTSTLVGELVALSVFVQGLRR